MKEGHIWLAVMIMVALAYLFCGCRSFDVDMSNPSRLQGVTYGAFCNLTVTKTTKTIDTATGQPVETTVAISSASTTAEIMGAFTELLGTLSAVGKEWKP